MMFFIQGVKIPYRLVEILHQYTNIVLRLGFTAHKHASLLVSCKLVRGDPCTEGSRTTKAGTDVQVFQG